MKIESISVENYKSFSSKQVLKLKPITILIGKNSSGKSSLAKLFTLLENSLSGNISEPLHFINNGVELGGEFVDLVYGKRPSDPIRFTINYEGGVIISVSILQEIGRLELTIFEWEIFTNDLQLSIKYSPENGYVDSSGNKYRCKFFGFIPSEIINENSENICEKIKEDFKIHVDYIGPFRVLPERQFYLTGQIEYNNTGVNGEFAYALLGVSKLMKTELHIKVAEWYKEFFDGWELLVDDSNRPFVQINLSKNENVVNIVDVGQGMNQALPLVVRANSAVSDSIIVLEQPELHLHPAAHGDLIELFSKSAKLNNQMFVIETHSENMLTRLRKLVVKNEFNLSSEDVVIYWVDESSLSGNILHEISISEMGVFSDWPDGVFNEKIKDIREMQNFLKEK
ncbi:MAG: DUF3696 domain-containing protein [Chitinophagaceae bacterium]|nr:DUF3696 domain-containing protein [Chitinophagaceae bacterium]